MWRIKFRSWLLRIKWTIIWAIRWQIAKLLDRRRDTCWANLVLWAQFPENHDFEDIFDLPRAGRCWKNGPTTYCGKCDVVHELQVAETLRLRRVFRNSQT